MLLVLVSHIAIHDFDFVRWPLHFEFPSYTSASSSSIVMLYCISSNDTRGIKHGIVTAYIQGVVPPRHPLLYSDTG